MAGAVPSGFLSIGAAKVSDFLSVFMVSVAAEASTLLKSDGLSVAVAPKRSLFSVLLESSYLGGGTPKVVNADGFYAASVAPHED